jgi:hypothetical protein
MHVKLLSLGHIPQASTTVVGPTSFAKSLSFSNDDTRWNTGFTKDDFLVKVRLVTPLEDFATES